VDPFLLVVHALVDLFLVDLFPVGLFPVDLSLEQVDLLCLLSVDRPCLWEGHPYL
jgi:hypothetical protein